MSDDPSKTTYIEFGKLIRDQIALLKGSEHEVKQVDIATSANIEPSSFSRMINGKSQTHYTNLTASQVEVLLEQLRLTDKAASIIIKYKLPVPIKYAGAVARLTGDMDHGPAVTELDWLEFQVYEAASAGTGDGFPVDDEDPIKLPRDFLTNKGADPRNTMVVKVNGDCMVSHEVRFAVKNLAHGDFAIVEIGRPPKPGDRQVFWDAQERMLIIKYVGEGENSNSVTLYDERGKIYHRPAEDPELIYRGVVLGRFGMY